MKYENKAELIEKAKVLREEGVSYYKISKELGIKGHDTIKIWLDPDARERKNAQGRRRLAENEECRKENNRRSAEYRIAHRDECNAYLKEYYAAHRDELNEHSRIYGREYRQTHRKEDAERMARWRKENPERSREIQIRHKNSHKAEHAARSRIRAARVKEYDEILQEEYDALLEAQNGLCAYCGKVLKTDGNPSDLAYYNLEHIYPVSRNGVHTLDNLVYAYRECNFKKYTKTIEEWRPELLEKVGNGVHGGEEMEKVVEEL